MQRILAGPRDSSHLQTWHQTRQCPCVGASDCCLLGCWHFPWAVDLTGAAVACCAGHQEAGCVCLMQCCATSSEQRSHYCQRLAALELAGRCPSGDGQQQQACTATGKVVMLQNVVQCLWAPRVLKSDPHCQQRVPLVTPDLCNNIHND